LAQSLGQPCGFSAPKEHFAKKRKSGGGGGGAPPKRPQQGPVLPGQHRHPDQRALPPSRAAPYDAVARLAQGDTVVLTENGSNDRKTTV
jgi:hypothetical protein